MRDHLAVGLAALLGLCAAPAWSQAEKERTRAELRIAGLRFSNFFEAPQGQPEEDITGASFEARLIRRLGERRPYEAYLHAGYDLYRGFDDGFSVEAGVRLHDRPDSFDASARFIKSRPSRDVGDEFDTADSWTLSGRYGYRITRDFEATAFADLRHETFDLAPDKQNDFYTVAASLRYRGFGWRFSPEVGYGVGRRDVRRDTEDLSQRELFVRLRWAPSPNVYVTGRYRRRNRDYDIEDPAAGNFGREDVRTQWTLTGDWDYSEVLSWNLYLTLQEADSTRPLGIFDNRVLYLGFTWHP